MDCPNCEYKMERIDDDHYICSCGTEITPEDIDAFAFYDEIDNQRHMREDEQGDW